MCKVTLSFSSFVSKGSTEDLSKRLQLSKLSHTLYFSTEAEYFDYPVQQVFLIIKM